jgi:hypothetical protein
MNILVLVVVVLLVLAGAAMFFRRRGRAGGVSVPMMPVPVMPVTVLARQTFTAFGRDYELQVLRSSPGGVTFETLQLVGDGMGFSFHASVGPFRPTVSGAVVSFGGHRIEVLSAPNEYRIDQDVHRLAPGAFYAFSDGEYLTRVF